MQQCVYQITFRNVYKFKKQLVKSGLVGSITLSIQLSVNGEIISMHVFAQWVNISINFIADRIITLMTIWRITGKIIRTTIMLITYARE